jgi:hypothetical protein
MRNAASFQGGATPQPTERMPAIAFVGRGFRYPDWQMSELSPPQIGAVPESPEDFGYYYDMAREIVRRVRHRAHLSDDEIIVLAMVAAQISLEHYVQAPRELDADGTLDAILDILDRGEVVQAVSSKMLWLLNHRPQARVDAPSGEMLEDFAPLVDPDEPSGI